MKRQTVLTGYLLIAAAVTFWISWFLMPDPGTTDTNHILAIVKQARMSVLCSVTTQIISSVLYTIASFLLVKITFPGSKALTGIALFGIGILGLCSDAFFHLLAWFMTSDSVTIQEDVVRVMNFMQTEALIFLVPLLLPFFAGSIVLGIGLNKQGIISKRPGFLFVSSLIIGLAGTLIANLLRYNGPVVSVTAIGIFAAGHVLIGLELLQAVKRVSYQLVTTDRRNLSRTKQYYNN